MKSPSAQECTTRQIILKGDSYWCLVESPEDCPYALQFDDSFVCIHPDRRNFLKNKPSSFL